MTSVTFEPDYMPLYALVALANAAAIEAKAYSMSNLQDPDDHAAMRQRHEAIVKAIEVLVMTGQDRTGKSIPADWDITQHVLFLED